MLDADGKRVAAKRPQLGAHAPRQQLAVVQPRRLVELRGRDAHAQGRRRHARCDRRRRPPRSKPSVDWGRYRLEVTSAEPDGPSASIVFNAGWYTAADEADSPEMLDVALDKRQLQAGRDRQAAHRLQARRQGARRRAGRRPALAAGGRRRRTAAARSTIAVGDDWGAGAYVTAMLYRPMDESAKRMPSRAIGVQWLGLDQAAATLNVALDAPEKVKSGTTLTVPVKIGGLAAGEEARITVAAVDVGILNLTRFEAPAPEDWFYAQRQLGIEIRDFYGRLIDGMRAERGTLRSGGDGGGRRRPAGQPAGRGRRSRCSPASSRSAPTARPASTSSCRTSTARCASWRSPGAATSSATRTSDVIVRDAVALTASASALPDARRRGAPRPRRAQRRRPGGAYKVAARSSDGRASSRASPASARPQGRRAQARAASRVKPTDVGLIDLRRRASPAPTASTSSAT